MTTTTYAVLGELDPALQALQASAWGLPTPADVVAVAGVLLLRGLAGLWVRATLNVASLGDWWPPIFWLVVIALVSLGQRGAAADAKLFAGGEDVAAFGSSGRASWLGAAAKVTRARVRLTAQANAAALVAGYGGAALLVVVAVLWVWLLPAGGLVVWWWWRGNMAPRPWITEDA